MGLCLKGYEKLYKENDGGEVIIITSSSLPVEK